MRIRFGRQSRMIRRSKFYYCSLVILRQSTSISSCDSRARLNEPELITIFLASKADLRLFSSEQHFCAAQCVQFVMRMSFALQSTRLFRARTESLIGPLRAVTWKKKVEVSARESFFRHSPKWTCSKFMLN